MILSHLKSQTFNQTPKSVSDSAESESESGAGVNDGLFQKRWTFVTLPSVLFAVTLCVSRRIDTWHIVYLVAIE